MFTHARGEEGFGLIELLIALVVLSVGLLAVVGVFVSGIVTIRRAAKISTAAAIADKEMEGWRDNKFATIALLTPVSTDGTYTSDAAYSSSQVTAASCTATPTSLCSSTQTVTGPDHHSYRVDTYVVYDNSGTGSTAVASNTLKKVTIVVRNTTGAWTSKPLLREVSNFDSAFG